MSSDSDHTQFAEDIERAIMVDFYIMGPIGITLSVIMLYSLNNLSSKLQKTNANDPYLRYAIISGYTLNFVALIVYVTKIVTNDLILPIDQLLLNNIGVATLGDTLLIIAWSIAKISFYFGFAFLYFSIFKKHENIDICFKILMVFAAFSTFAYCVYYAIDDALVESSKEIGITEKRGIYFVSYINPEQSMVINLVSSVGIGTDFIFVGVLLYRFISAAKESNNYYYHGVRAVVLLIISSIAVLAWVMVTVLGYFYIFDNAQIMTDSICLFLMFDSNKETYNNLCGKCCDTCCGAICFGSKYKPIRADDEEQDGDDQQSMI